MPLLCPRHPSDNQFDDFREHTGKDIHPPISHLLSADVNMRGVDVSAFTCSAESRKNILYELMRMGHGLIHETKYRCLVSSLEEAETDEVHASSPNILSYVTGWRHQLADVDQTKFKAIKIDKGTLKKAICIFDSEYNSQAEDTIESMFESYVNVLEKEIPKSNGRNELAQFIDDFMLPQIKQHPEKYWGGAPCLLRCEKLVKECLDTTASVHNAWYLSNTAKFLRSFIHQNFALMTKVIASFIDGNHRVLGLDSVITGSFFDGPLNMLADIEDKDEYFNQQPLPHLKDSCCKHFVNVEFLESDLNREASNRYVIDSVAIGHFNENGQDHDLFNVILSLFRTLHSERDRMGLHFLVDPNSKNHLYRMARYGVSTYAELKEVLNTLLPEHGMTEMEEIIDQRILRDTTVPLPDKTEVSAPFKLYFHVYALILGKVIMRVMKDEVDGRKIPQSYREIGSRSGLFLGPPSGNDKLFGAEVREREGDAQDAAILEERIFYTLLGMRSFKGDSLHKRAILNQLVNPDFLCGYDNIIITNYANEKIGGLTDPSTKRIFGSSAEIMTLPSARGTTNGSKKVRPATLPIAATITFRLLFMSTLYLWKCMTK